MITKALLKEHRVRKINGSFAWISHRFLRQGYWNNLNHQELVLYFFLVIVADRRGMSYYGYDKICSLTAIGLDEYIQARNGLIDKDLIAFDGRLFQVLSLPPTNVVTPTSRKPEQSAGGRGLISIGTIFQKSFNSLGGQNA
ncbi:MAG: hypothetical protein HQK65_07445 [Desulfamplus sp.]|nr:hypothetical protein [Desulfamplus sp.]